MSDAKPQDLKPQVEEEATWPLPKDIEEHLAVDPGKNSKNVWALKLPRFLLERWERVPEAGVELGTLVVDSSVNPPRIHLRLPPDAAAEDEEEKAGEPSTRPAKRRKYDTRGVPDEYEVQVPNDRAKNTFVFQEKVRDWGLGQDGRKRLKERAEPKLVAAVAHEGAIKPTNNEKYRKILEQRRLESEQTRRPIIQLESTGIGKSELNRLASGYSNLNSRFGKGFIAATQSNTSERHARMDEVQLTSRLFQCFNDKPYWGIPALKSLLQQPDQWLREVLRKVADQIKEGPYANMWKLKDSWKLENGEASDAKASGENEDEDDDMEGDEKPDLGWDEDDDDEDDFEEVM